MSEIYYIDTERKKRNTAGAKAPDDIAELCRRCGYRRIAMPLFPSSKPKLMQKLWLLTVCVYRWLEVMKLLPEGCIVLYQHPQYGIRVAEKMISFIKKRKKCRFICIIHDLESLRGGIEGVIEKSKKTNEVADNILLRHMDCLICHNERMRDYLIKKGYPPFRLVCLGIFDYLVDKDQLEERGFPHKTGSRDTEIKASEMELANGQSKDHHSIAIAGNLAYGKSGYIYKITENGKNANLQIYLYGDNYEEKKGTGNVHYMGSFKPEKLIRHLQGEYGLVWDGISSDTCAGNTGEYLRYNNPHKTSLYLAAGIPVVVWEEAAIADFVLRNDVGIVVGSLDRLEEALRTIRKEDYIQMCQNVSHIGSKIRNGEFFMVAMKKALDIVANRE